MARSKVVTHSFHGPTKLFSQAHGVARNPNDGTEYEWSARNNRKRRHRLEHKRDANKARHVENTAGRVLRLFTAIEYWNSSWWVAVIFTAGSIVWCINGVYSFLPFIRSDFPMQQSAIGWTAWLGATLFEFGGIVALWEAWSVDDDKFFGWGAHKKHDMENGSPATDETPDSTAEKSPQPGEPRQKKYDLGLWAAAVQWISATIFWMAGWTSIPVIYKAIEKSTGLLDGVYWTPQLIGLGFVVSGLLSALETQHKWYKPNLSSLGWHVGVWNAVGGLGFFLCGAFGYSKAHWCLYQSALSTFWGSWAFLISSVVQWYEAVNPVQPQVVQSGKT